MTIATIPIYFGLDAAAGSIGPVNAGSTMTFAAVAAYIAEMGVAAGSGGGVIRKAHLEVTGVTNSGTAMQTWTLGLAIDGGTAFTVAKTGQTIGGPGSYYSWRVDADFTDALAANWPAADPSVSIVATIAHTGTTTNPPIVNVTAILWVTVEFTAASCPTQTKWLSLLVGSYDGGTSASAYTTIATVPQLTGLSAGTFRLPEASITMRQAIVEVLADSGGLMSGASLGTPQIRIDGTTAYTFASETATGAGVSRYERFFVTAPATTAAATVELRTTSGNASYPYLYAGAQTLAHYVYTFDATTTTHVAVAAYHYVGQGAGSPGYGTEDNALELFTQVHVPEATIDAQGPMGWRVNVGDSDHFALNLRGYQYDGPGGSATVLATKTSQRYERVRHSDSGDNAEWAHRVDAGAGAGGAHALASGFNYFGLAIWASDISAIVGGETYRRGVQLSACFHYAYVVAVPAAGPHAVTRVVEVSLQPMTYSSTPSGEARFWYSSKATADERAAPPLPTTTAYYQGLGLRLFQVQNTTAINISVDARQAGFPFQSLYSGHPYAGFAVVWSRVWIDLTKFYLRYTAQPVPIGAGWSPPTDLDVQLCCGNSSRCAWTFMAAYHEQLTTITVAVTGYSGDGSAIDVAVYRADTGERVADLVTSAGGGVTFGWAAGPSLYASASQGGTAGASLPTTGSTLTVEFAGANKGLGSKFNQGIN